MNIKIKDKLIFSLSLVILILFSACEKENNFENIICEYSELDCLYYSKDSINKYKYSDYIYDDVSDGSYIFSTPSIAKYTANGELDIPNYVKAKSDYSIKVDLIDKYKDEIKNICNSVQNDYFEQKIMKIYYYDNTSKNEVLLYDGYVTNLSYDDEVPIIMFDVPTKDTKLVQDSLKDRKMMLSDIFASNSTIEGYMRVILGAGKERLKFYMDEQVS